MNIYKNNTRKIIQNQSPYNLYNETIHKYPIVVSIPHSGVLITQDMAENLRENIILPNMDWYIPKLYSFLKNLNVTVIINNMSRYVIDPNRNPNMNKGNSYLNNVIYETTTFGFPMYKKPLDNKIKETRKVKYYIPYHNELTKLLYEKKKYFEKVYLIDLHSYGMDTGSDVVIGNCFDKSCSYKFRIFIKNLLEKQNLIVNENTPFSGGYITQNYGNIKNIEAIQIELCYRFY